MTDDDFYQLPIFQDLTSAQIDSIRPYFVASECHAGTILFEQGEPAVFIYLLISGEVAIHYKPEDGQELIVTRIKPGGVVGWSAVIGRRQYTSAAECTQFSRLMRMRGSDLQTLREQCPEAGCLLLERLAQSVAERLNGTHPQVVALLENSLRKGIQEEAK
jgi:CRP/FNR family transcriptional regulator, cyclic AMP receptor protein